jgi:16S rRNA (guanine527-N7)-methyltransferase
VTLAATLAQGLAAMGCRLLDGAAERLLRYVWLLDKWNRTYNLTAVREPEKMVAHHLLDSLSVLPYVGGKRIIDVGTGAGLPGIPLALALPEAEVVLLDSSHKKMAFVEQALMELRIENARAVCRRVEDYRPEQPFGVVISRACSDLADFFRLTRHLGGQDTRWLAMKGVYPHEEIALLKEPATVDAVVRLDVPGLGAERHLVIVKAH